eukprot:1843188-Rhodomonas_salina.1
MEVGRVQKMAQVCRCFRFCLRCCHFGQQCLHLWHQQYCSRAGLLPLKVLCLAPTLSVLVDWCEAAWTEVLILLLLLLDVACSIYELTIPTKEVCSELEYARWESGDLGIGDGR